MHACKHGILSCFPAVLVRLSINLPRWLPYLLLQHMSRDKMLQILLTGLHFRERFAESNLFCSGEGTMFGATGRLLEFRSSCEFDRVCSLVTALNPTALYLTGRSYDMQGNLRDSIAMGTGLSTILVGTALQLSGATENAEKCVAIGRTSESTAL